MKKVLALVLAVVMVCTMAMAATVDGAINTSGAAAATTPGETYDIVAGGTNYYVNLKDANLYFKDGKFVPANNVITVEYAAGSDLVASAGWVKITKATQDLEKGIVTGPNDTYSYQYQIVLKNDFTRVADGKAADFSITKITLKATGWEAQPLFTANEKEGKVIKADIGYEVVKTPVTVAEDGTVTINPTESKINNISAITKGDTQLDTVTVKVLGNATPSVKAVYSKLTLNKGANVFYAAAAKLPAFDANDKGNETDNTVATIVNKYNLPATAVVEQTDVHAAKVYNVYAKGIDGKISAVAATLNDGVLTFNVPALATVIVTTNTLTVTATTSTGSTGTTTNPGTGANDVVGVAAALAVVALVSGAAISLKK